MGGANFNEVGLYGNVRVHVHKKTCGYMYVLSIFASRSLPKGYEGKNGG